MLLGLMGGALGLALAYAGLRVLVAVGPGESAAAERNLAGSARSRIHGRPLAVVELCCSD